MTEASYPHVFRPITLGGMRLRDRVMVPPHGSGIGNLWGTDAEAETHMAYWESRALDGAQWAELAGRVRKEVSLPVVYAGRVNTVAVAEQVLAAGHAEVIDGRWSPCPVERIG